MKKCIILANGDKPKKSVVAFLKKKGYATLICADGGANSAQKLNLVPDYIIGDFDSIDKSVREFFSDKCSIIQIKRQNDTDVEKCLKFAIKKGFTDVMLLGATGSRLDHSFCNLGLVLKFFEQIKIKILHENSLLEAVDGSVTLKASANEIISIYGIDQKTTITSNGLKYILDNTALPFGEKESTSNVALANSVSLDIKRGRIFLIRDFEAMKKNDLI
ncbi:MAG: thiamine pyrophosphokinase [Ignavibacteria bacterium]|nr:MAG: thiamine pyrophosphokinase [Ignavibacteria bacterium]KAF0160650.1 MAG: thiamine pyrophosphokinase [Ignavibacteria bacterium]